MMLFLSYIPIVIIIYTYIYIIYTLFHWIEMQILMLYFCEACIMLPNLPLINEC